jgi:hypothetical protein
MRQADLLDGRAGPLERRHCGADGRLDARLHAGDEVFLRQPEALAVQPGGGFVIGLRQGEQLVRHRDRR